MFSLSVNEIFKAIEASDHHLLREALVTINLETLLSFKNAEGQPLLHYAVIHQNYPAFKLMIEKVETSQEPGLKEKVLLSTDAQGNSLLAYINVAEKCDKFLYTFANLLKNRAGDNPLLGFGAAGKLPVAQLQRDIEAGDLGQVKRYSDQGGSFKVRYPATTSPRSPAGVVQESQPEVFQRATVTQPGGNTPLHSAVQMNQLAIVQHIIACDPELFCWTNFSGQTALQLAQQHLAQPGTEDRTTQQAIVNYLSTQERELSDPETLKQRMCQQLFRTIASGGTTDLCYFLEQLTDLTPLLEIKNAQGQSLLHCAINAGNKKAISLLFKKIEQDKAAKKILSLTDNQGDSVLHYAVTTQDIILICRLVSAGSDLSLKNSDQLTAYQQYQIYQPDTYKPLETLPQKIELGNLLFIKEYVAQGFPLQVRYRDGNNPLHLAVQKNQLEIVQYLVENEPQLFTTKNFYGQTPKELASVTLEAHQGTITVLQQTLQLMKAKEQPLSKADSEVLGYNEQALQTAEHAKERFDAIVQVLSEAEENRENWTPPVVKPDLLASEPLNLQQVREVASLFEEFNKVSQQGLEPQQLLIDKLRPYLSTVWSVAQTYCDSALQALQVQPDRPESKQLLESLLGSNYDSAAVERQIKRVAYYLQEVKNSGKIEESIELHATAHDEQVAGWVEPDQLEFGEIKKINLVPTQHTSLREFVHTLIHEVSHIANSSVDFSYTHSEKEIAKEHQGSIFHRIFNGLVQLAASGEPDILKFNRRNYRIFEIALINKLLSNQCTTKEVEEILKNSEKIINLIHLEGELIDNNVKLITQEDSRYASLATNYGYLEEINTRLKNFQMHDLEKGEKFIASPRQMIENFCNIETCQQEKVAALRAQAKRVKPMIVLHNADSIAVSIGILAGLQGIAQESTTGSTAPSIEEIVTGLLNLAGLAKVEENRSLDVPAPPRGHSSEDTIQSLQEKIKLLEQKNDELLKCNRQLQGGEKGASFEAATTERSSPDNPDSDANIDNLKQGIVMIGSHLTGSQASAKPLLISGESSTIVTTPL